jgi:hypothetical protein
MLAKKSGTVTGSFAFLPLGDERLLTSVLDSCRAREVEGDSFEFHNHLVKQLAASRRRDYQDSAPPGLPWNTRRSRERRAFPETEATTVIPSGTQAFKWGVSSVSPDDDLCAMMCVYL